MDFSLSQEQEMFREYIKKFLRNYLRSKLYNNIILEMIMLWREL